MEHESEIDIDVDDPIHQSFRASVEDLVEAWRHRVIDLREPVDPVIDLRYLPEPLQATVAPIVLDIREGVRDELSA